MTRRASARAGLLDDPFAFVNARTPTLAAALSIAGLLGWLAYGAPEEVSPVSAAAPAGRAPPATLLQERSAGSEVPCAVPLGWRVARVDREFGMTDEQASEIIREAAALWEDAMGRELFRMDPEDGFPIRLVYDERQERAAERAERQQALDDRRAEIEARGTELTARQQQYQAAVADHLGRARDLDRRIRAHNAAIEAWNGTTDGPDDVWRELEAAGAALQQERDALEAERRALDGTGASLRAAETELNERIREHERLADQLDGALPPEQVEAGVYREAVSRQGVDVVAVSREIRLYRFTDADELRLLAAHEMGHALGLGHLDGSTDVMSARARGGTLPSGPSPNDVELLRRTCPGTAPARAR